MGDLDRRVAALEELVEEKVRERLEEELDAVLKRLEEYLPEDEAMKIMKVLTGDEYLRSTPVKRNEGRAARE